MGEEDDGLCLGLSLNLGFTQNHQQQQPCLKTLLQSSGRTPDTRSFLRGIDVNQAPKVTDCEEEGGVVSSPNSTVSSLSGKRSERGTLGEEYEAERASSSHGSDDEEGGGGDADGSRKKLKLSREQYMVLEQTFREHNTLNPKQKLALAKQLNLRPRQVEVWFQNRRARTKLKQTEVDCEYLKRCCEELTQENRNLQKEVHELRALKFSPNHYVNMKPPTTLTMCPSCERVAVSSSSSSSSAAAAAISTIPSWHQPVRSNAQRPIHLSPWAALSIQQRQYNAPTSLP